jgi:hypothetical protein
MNKKGSMELTDVTWRQIGHCTKTIASAAIGTRAEPARVQSGYEKLNPDATKSAFEELDKVLQGLAEQVIHTLDQMIPHLAEMQSLLSQRGKARKKVLKTTGLPSWPEYGKAYAAKLDCSFRTIQDHITGLHRNGKSGPSQSTKNGQQPKRDSGSKRSKPWHADAKDSRAMAESQLAINDFVAAYEAGADLEPAYQQYKKLAVSPSKLNAMFEAATSGSTKADVDTEVKKKLVPVVETVERYIRALEALVHSPSVTLTEDQRKTLQKPLEGWRSILRYARGVQTERTGKGVSAEDAPVVLKEAA